MTVKDLSQLYYLNREIEADQKRLDELRAKIGPRSPQITGMPHATGSKSNEVERYAVEITDLEAIIAAKQIQCIHERTRLERYIAGIEANSEVRLIFTLRFINGLSWEQVAAHIGAGHTADRVRMVCYRYLKKNKSTTI